MIAHPPFLSMTRVKAFRGVRPHSDLISDLMLRQFDHVILDKMANVSLEEIDARAEKLGFDLQATPQLEYFIKVGIGYRKLLNTGKLQRDPKPCFYVVGVKWENHWLYGIVGAVHYADYWNDHVKKHEGTLEANEAELVKITESIDFNFNPIMLAYPDHKPMDDVLEQIVTTKESSSFYNSENIEHRLWVVDQQDLIDQIEGNFTNIENTYIADGHHRIESGSIVAKKRNEKGDTPAEAPHNYFLAIHMSSSQLRVYEFNRLLKDFGLYDSAEQFLDELKLHFDITIANEPVRPSEKFHFGLYMDKQWYELSYKHATDLGDDPVDNLDVSVLRKEIMTRILGIYDFRTTDKISFVEGGKGIEKLINWVDKGDFVAAFTLCPLKIDEMFDIANLHEVMPAKATCIEPKLKSGMISRLLS